MLADPLANIRRINVPQLLRVELGSGPMEPEMCIWYDANVLARNIANEYGAC